MRCGVISIFVIGPPEFLVIKPNNTINNRPSYAVLLLKTVVNSFHPHANFNILLCDTCEQVDKSFCLIRSLPTPDCRGVGA